ncbi:MULTISPECIES: hypothetical protein [unclassified Sphingomonas]|uniref:hypothetical protein n=1 Tax=unclassified Sphingomonas TaxID=196159 RepID=UPI00161572FF|nr:MULTISPECIES: hypothetical protein [unclassified Sphingomonas]MBB3348580.1 hypothetical protein [Sphingomonas sp. BK069]MBB3474864.1 hypothetical protein [Sphingomonas sp. BK345]
MPASFSFPVALPPRAVARLLLAATIMLIAIGLLSPAPPTAHPAATASNGDAALYRAIDRRVADGQGYYAAVAAEHRARDFPLKPFVAVRLPTRAWIYRLVGAQGALWALRALALLAAMAFAYRLRATIGPRLLWGGASAIAAASALPLANAVVALWPECWAGLLVALSLASRDQRRWRVAALLGLAAALFRELALPYLVAMAFAAVLERRHDEALGWAAAATAAVIALTAHASAVAAILRPGDAVSQGWVRAGGWSFDLAMARATTPLALFPTAATAVCVPLALYGWVSNSSGYTRRVTLALVTLLVPTLLIGRPENSYWGLMLAPVWLAGLPLALPAIARAVAPAATATRQLAIAR